MNQEHSGGEIGSEWLERDDHPLLNNVVLTEVLHRVRLFDLKECRGVCQKWNLHTIPHMRSAFKAIIHASQSNYHRIGQFVKLFGKNELGIPFDTFNLGSFCRLGPRFLDLCGETAKEIDLSPLGQSNPDNPEIHVIEHVSKLLASTPNLQVFGFPCRLVSNAKNVVKLLPVSNVHTLPCLKKVIFRLEEEELVKYCPTFLEEIFTAAPNISELVLYDTWVDDRELEEGVNPKSSSISAVLDVIEKLGKESSIQSMYLCDARNEHIEHLRRMAQKQNGLKLKNLTFYPNTYLDDDGLQTVELQVQLAQIFKDSLEYLDTLFSATTTTNDLMNFPIMPRLKTLKFKVIDVLDSNPVNLNNLFPALKTIVIAMVIPHWHEPWPDFFYQFDSCPNIKSLTVDFTLQNGDVEFVTFDTFYSIRRVFPNLTKLDLGWIEDDCVEILSQIWSQMTQLESFTVSCDVRGNPWTEQIQSVDSLFTGIPTETLVEIRHVVNELDKMTVDERREKILDLTDQHCQRPSVRNLTKLKFLNLEVDGQGDNSKLTDLTAYLALYSMKHLRHLTVELCRFTKNCCHILRDETGLEYWSFKKEPVDMGIYIYEFEQENNIIPPFLHQTEN